ncbi:MAG: CmcI family methyltransferase [Acidobacteriota bacterium]
MKLLRRLLYRVYIATLAPWVHRLFFTQLIRETNNFGGLTWLGQPIWQNVLDLWTIQEALSEVRPALLVECGTHQGGSALFYAHLFDLMGTKTKIVSVDITRRTEVEHPRIEFLTGSSTADDMVAQVAERVAAADGPVMVILDSDHSEGHVRAELERYAGFVTPGSFLLVQDGVIDTLGVFRAGRPGPLPAIRSFLASHPEFALDRGRCDRFLITHHPLGWMRRLPAP